MPVVDADFSDIKIIGLDDDYTVTSPQDASLLYIFLKLSQTPPPLWQKHFTEARKIPRHPKWRRAWLDRKFIVVECKPDELEAVHLNDLKHDVATANAKYRAYVEDQTQSIRLREQTQSIDRTRLREIKGRLNFD